MDMKPSSGKPLGSRSFTDAELNLYTVYPFSKVQTHQLKTLGKAEWLPFQKVAEGEQEACGTRPTDRHPPKAAPHLGYNGIEPCLTPGIVSRIGVQHPAPVQRWDTALDGVSSPASQPRKPTGRGILFSLSPGKITGSFESSGKEFLNIFKVKRITQR